MTYCVFILDLSDVLDTLTERHQAAIDLGREYLECLMVSFDLWLQEEALHDSYSVEEYLSEVLSSTIVDAIGISLDSLIALSHTVFDVHDIETLWYDMIDRGYHYRSVDWRGDEMHLHFER